MRPLGSHLGAGEDTLELGPLVLAFLDDDVYHRLQEGFLLLQTRKSGTHELTMGSRRAHCIGQDMVYGMCSSEGTKIFFFANVTEEICLVMMLTYRTLRIWRLRYLNDQ